MIFDFHNDILTSLEKIEAQSKLTTYNGSLLAGLTLAVWTSRYEKHEALDKINYLIEYSQKIDTNYKKFYAVEDLHFINEYNIFKLVKLPLLYCTLSWNYDNSLCGGALGKAGLSKIGKKIIDSLESHHILIDTSHTNQHSFYDIMSHCKNPVLNSHTAINELNDHKRNLTNTQIRSILNSGGLVCLTLVPKFLSDGEASIEDYIRQIDYFADKFGIEGLAIGTDFYGCDFYVKDMTEYTDFCYLGYRLKKLGYTPKDVNKIFYLNATEFITRSKYNARRL